MELQTPTPLSSEERMSASPSPPLTEDTDSPRPGSSPSRDTTEAQRRRQQRHSKKLSINFPILLPARGGDTPSSQYTASPGATNIHCSVQGTYFSPPSTYSSNSAVPSSVTLPVPLTPPSEEDPLHVVARNKGHIRRESSSTEFLTLLASQERRVLELKEELLRAETELTALKKHWAVYEASKKKNEAKGQPARTRPVGSTHTRAASVVEAGTGLGLSGVEDPVSEEKLEAEREKRREIARERMLGRVTNADAGQASNGNGKKTGQRVFSSSRHTRTLSLLTATTNTKTETPDSLESVVNGKTSLDSSRQPSVDTPPTTVSPSLAALSRTNSGLEALNFSKTYKELASAASRKNLPQGLNPEQFVKHGKQVVDGVRDGLWNFFEDIRQATVGEEAITGVRRQNSTRQASNSQAGTGQPKLRRTMTDAGNGRSGTRTASLSLHDNEPSFWKEFGVDSPKSDKIKRETTVEKDNDNTTTTTAQARLSRPSRHSSTKSTGPPSTTCCPKHTQTHAKKPRSRTHHPPNSSDYTHEHHTSKSSTSSDHPPSLVADLLDDEDDGWDTWDSRTVSEPGSPGVERKKRGGGDGIGARAQREREREREVQWHDLTS